MDKNKKRAVVVATIVFVAVVGMLTYELFFKNNILSTSEGVKSTTEAQNEDADTKSTSSDLYSDKDLKTSYDEDKATKITLGDTIKIQGDNAKASGDTVTISKEGDYVISGTLGNGGIVVNAGDNDDVHIILDGVDITNKSYAPIYVKNSDKTIITLKEGSENTITDGSSYSNLVEDEPDGAIFSHDDLTINGDGSLKVTSNYQDAIAVKDDLRIISSTIDVKSADDGIRGKDSVAIKDAKITVEVAGDGIKTTNETEEDKGILTVDSGKINIKNSYEGLEGRDVVINGGDIDIVATDDGINAAGGADAQGSSDVSININGGTINVAAAQSGRGDGVDSNGSINIKAGTIKIASPTNPGDYSSLDCESEINMTDGKVYVDEKEYTKDNVSELGQMQHGGKPGMNGHGGMRPQ